MIKCFKSFKYLLSILQEFIVVKVIYNFMTDFLFCAKFTDEYWNKKGSHHYNNIVPVFLALICSTAKSTMSPLQMDLPVAFMTSVTLFESLLQI